jgi:hypothetical protein
MTEAGTIPAAVERFPIRLQQPTLLRIFGVRTGERAMVTLDDTALEARFGIAHVRVPLADITSWDISGPWNPITALGIRRSVRGGDLTFGGSAHGGVQVHFKDRPKILIFRPPSLYLTVDDLEGLGAALTARGIPGEDLRGR